MEHLPGYKEACEVLRKHTSSRAKTMAKLESYVEGTQYAGLPDWFSDKKPLWERAPCIVYPIVKTAIDSNSDLLLGEGRYPVVTVEGESGETADEFEKAVASAAQHARLRAVAREIFAAAQGSGTACAIFGIRGGRLFIDTVFARWCEPVLDVEGAVQRLEIQYPFLAVEPQENGEQKVVCKIYRRAIDAFSDITYLPAKAPEDGKKVTSWTPDVIITHGFGFCPVVWYAHQKGCSVIGDFDGEAIHRHLTDEIRALDFALSQRHRAALYCGDPQWTEIGVDPGYNPSGAGGRKAEVPASLTGGFGESPTAYYVAMGMGGNKARKKSPGGVWQYPGDASKIKVDLHTLPGDALKPIDDHARDLRGKLAEALGIVLLEAESLPNESRLSGRALETMRSRQLARIDCYRSDFGDRFLLPALGMVLRIALHAGLKIQGIDVIKSTIAKQPLWSWHTPQLALLWGDYFKPSGEEEYQMMQSAALAKESGIATTRVLVEKLRGILGIKDVEAYMKELETETTENEAKALKQVEAEAKATAAAKPKPAGPAK